MSGLTLNSEQLTIRIGSLIAKFCVLTASDRFVVTVDSVVNHTVDLPFVRSHAAFNHEFNIRASN